MKYKLSKKAWLEAGKKAGWTKMAQPATAPVKTPVKTPTEKPGEKPGKQDPFSPQVPKRFPLPAPKALKKKIENPHSIEASLKRFFKSAQTYEEGAVEPVRNFWTQIPEEHPFSKHPVLSQYGHNLSRDGYDWITQKMHEKNQVPVANVGENHRQVMEIMREIFQLEADHKDELIDAAKQITNETWGIESDRLEAFLTTNPQKRPVDEGVQEEMFGGEMEGGDDFEGDDFEGGGGEEGGLVPIPEGDPRPPVEMTPRLRNEVNKRITMNALTQGAAVHAMASVHHLVADRINQISPRLLDLYSRLSFIATQHYYAIDIPSILATMGENLEQASVGWSQVVRENAEPEADEALEGLEGEDGPEGLEEPAVPREPEVAEQGPVQNFKIVTQAICFPVLCQELFKGVMELISLNGIPYDQLTPEEWEAIHDESDRLQDEPWLITVGPALWRKFIAAIPEGMSLSQAVMKFSQSTPQEVERVTRAVIQAPDVAKEYFQGLQAPEVVEQYQEPEVPEVLPEEIELPEDEPEPWKTPKDEPKPWNAPKDKGLGGFDGFKKFKDLGGLDDVL